MIDTIVLSVPTTESELQRKSADGIPVWALHGRKIGYDTYTKESMPGDGLYYPKVTAFRHRGTIGSRGASVRIEFSAPKLIHGNNLQELSDIQFTEVVSVLCDRLKNLGFEIGEVDLENASVRAVHYSRNIEILSGYTALYAIGEIGKININSRFDMARTRYLNDGQSLCLHTRSHSFAIYDKIADLMRGKGKANDVTQTEKQAALATEMEGREVLRLEVRLSEKRKMNTVLSKAGFAENPTFREVFSVDKSTAVLKHYWNTMVAGHGHVLFAHAPTPKDLLKYLLLAKPTTGARQAVFLAGLLLLIRDGNGIRELRTLLKKHMVDRTWYRMVAEIKAVEAELTTLQPRGWYVQIVSALDIYKPFQTSNTSSNGVKLIV